MSLNDKAWNKLFITYNILDEINRNGFYEIDAKTIKTVREPRLMAKFDHKSNLPEIFRENGISILPISRSRYVLGEFDAYHKVKYNNKIEPIEMSLPIEISTIDPFNLYSESSAIHCAHASGMIADILGEECVQTVSGRMSSQSFKFKIDTYNGNDYKVDIQNAQVEIDGGFEGDTSFAIIEAKKETVNDFLIRQLYYPYRLWEKKLDKFVKPIFFTHSNDVFSFFVYEFEDPKRYNSLRLIKQKNYIIAHEYITLDDIIETLHKSKVGTAPKLPFPQANSFARIIDLLGLLVDNDLEKDFITSNYNFDVRQTNYYTSAAMYIGLVERYLEGTQVKFRLSKKGYKIMKKPYKQKYLSIAKAILENPVYNQVLKEYFDNGYMPSDERIVEIMKRAKVFNVGKESTYFRRASTVVRWIDWILDLQND
jgi:hypothetical protein